MLTSHKPIHVEGRISSELVLKVVGEKNTDRYKEYPSRPCLDENPRTRWKWVESRREENRKVGNLKATSLMSQFSSSLDS